MRQSTHVLAAAILSAAWLFSSPAANAQNQSAPPNLSDQKLDAAAAAVNSVAGIKRNVDQQLSTAAPSDKDRIMGDANTKITKAINAQGLSVDEYAQILQVAQNDPSVREKLLQRLKPPAK
jgi:hypothetical protein